MVAWYLQVCVDLPDVVEKHMHQRFSSKVVFFTDGLPIIIMTVIVVSIYRNFTMFWILF